MKFAIVDYGRSIPRKRVRATDPFKHTLWRAVTTGLRVMGHQAEYLCIDSWMPSVEGVPCAADAFIFWNGQKKHRARCRAQVEAAGRLVICVEHGWFKRKEYFHFSLSGHFGPFAHFAGEMADAMVVPAMVARMEEITGGVADEAGGAEPGRPDYSTWKVGPLRARIKQANPGLNTKDMRKAQLIEIANAIEDQEGEAEIDTAGQGHALLALQVNSDAQHGPGGYDCIEWANNVLGALAEARWNGPVRVRNHPDGGAHPIGALTVPGALQGRVEAYSGRDVDLQADIAGADMVIAHNSNLINDALLHLKPCITTGPHLANPVQGVVLSVEPVHVAGAVTLVHKGWKPQRDAVVDYMTRLCDRQWNVEEIRAGKVLGRLLVEAEEQGGGGELP